MVSVRVCTLKKKKGKIGISPGLFITGIVRHIRQNN